LSTWIYRLCVLVLWGLLGRLFLPHLKAGEGAVLAACILGAMLLPLAVGLVRSVWAALFMDLPWESPPARR